MGLPEPLELPSQPYFFINILKGCLKAHDEVIPVITTEG